MRFKIFQKDRVWHVKKWEWIVVILAVTIPLLSFLYEDTHSIIRCGIDVVKSIAEGRFFEYYTFATESKEAGLMIHPPTYDILFYLTVGIWELPIAVIELVTGNTLQNSALAMMYSKCLLVVFLLLSAWMVKKIAVAVKLTEKAASWAAFMFATSGFVFAYMCIAGQYDIMGIFFTLVGVYYFIKEDNKKFLLFFAIAAQYKFFPLFVFIPLLLLKEKNIVKIAINMLGVTIPMAILRLPFLGNTLAMMEKNKIQGEMIERIFGNRIPILETEVPISLLLVGAVCIFCYIKDLEDTAKPYYAVFIPFLSLAALFISFPFFPYWIIYLAPWTPILFFMRKEKSDRRYVIEVGMAVSLILVQFSHFEWVFELENARGMLLDRFIFPYESFTNPLTISNFSTILPIEDFEYFLYGIYILCVLAMIILYWPKKKMEYQTETYPFRAAAWLRFAIVGFTGLVPFLLYVGSIVREIIFF